MTFPFLDIEFYWDASDFLATRVFLKPNQRIKYLSAHSDHTRSCIKAVPNGVLQRLTKLTSVSSENIDARIDELYPTHAKALRSAGLAPTIFPTLLQATIDLANPPSLSKRCTLKIGKSVGMARMREKKRKEKERRRSTYFCIGVSEQWTTPIHVLLKRLRDKFKLNWL